MMLLLEDILIRCGECGKLTRIYKEDVEFYTRSNDHGDNCMGEEIEYQHEDCMVCDRCGNQISFIISGYEYPVGAFNYEDSKIFGGFFEEKPHMGIFYDREDFDVNNAYPEYSRIEQMIKKIADAPAMIYDISPREFEEVIERLLQDQGFETTLTQQTRDGGKDIIATKYELGKPIVFYIECKRYGMKNSVDVSMVRSLCGVQSADRVNKSILVTTGPVTRDARAFVESQNTMMSILDVDEIHDLIQQSAEKYGLY